MAIRYPGKTGTAVTPHVIRSERRWSIGVGGREISVTRSSYSWALVACSDRTHLLAPPPRPPAIARTVGLVLASLAGLLTIALAVQSGRASAGARYVLSVAVPPPVVERRPSSHRRHQARIVRAVPDATRAATSVADDSLPGAEVADGDTQPVETLATQREAIAAALGTGRLAQWTGDAGAERGFIVAGPLESGADGECRALSVLVRRAGEQDRVENRRDCLPRVHRGTPTPP